MRLELRHGDCGRKPDGSWDDCAHGNERLEFVSYSVRHGENDISRYGWSVFFPRDFPSVRSSGPKRPEIFLGQFHDTRGQLFAFFHGGWQPGNGGLMVKGPHDGRDFHGPWRAAVLSKSEMTGRWNDILVDARWTRRADGYFRVAVNGSYVAAYAGPTLNRGDSVVFKLGIYRMDTIPAAGTAVVYYDRIFRNAA